MRGFLTFGAYRLLGALMGPMPSRVGYWMARRVGPLLIPFSPQMKRILFHNMRHVLGPDADETEVRRRVRQACVKLAKSRYHPFRPSRLSIDQSGGMIRREGKRQIDVPLARGKRYLSQDPEQWLVEASIWPLA